MLSISSSLSSSSSSSSSSKWLKLPKSCSHILKKENNVLLVIAHPDDEIMFFSPILNYFSNIRNLVSILCLSTGI